GRTSVPYTITDFATRGLERNIELRAYSTSSSKYTVLDKIKVRAILEENLSPATPTINGDRILTISKTGEWVLYSTDPNNEKIRYGVDWNNDNVVDQWIPDNPETPGNDFVLSGQSVKANYYWSSLGKKTFKVLTQDYYGGNNSPWESFEVEVVSEDQVFVSLTASKYQINEGESTDLKWVSNADTCSSEQFETSSLSNGTKSVSPANTTTYFITCRRGEQMATDNKKITVNGDNPLGLSVTLVAKPSENIKKGQEIVLEWTASREGSFCSIPNPEVEGEYLVKDQSYTGDTGLFKPQKTNIYEVYCQNGSLEARNSVKITVDEFNPIFNER
ncbi:MAG: hypothetical protein PHT84_00685, partial [Candidatus Pacebacteria bacterium]|nr:hypothetical protein [Candidatus Paceibacterota bacterium]